MPGCRTRLPSINDLRVFRARVTVLTGLQRAWRAASPVPVDCSRWSTPKLWRLLEAMVEQQERTSFCPMLVFFTPAVLVSRPSQMRVDSVLSRVWIFCPADNQPNDSILGSLALVGPGRPARAAENGIRNEGERGWTSHEQLDSETIANKKETRYIVADI